jgi:hypothetical protein
VTTGRMNPVLKRSVKTGPLIKEDEPTFSQTEPFLCSAVDTQRGLGRMLYNLTIPFISSVKHKVTSRDSPKCGSAARK